VNADPTTIAAAILAALRVELSGGPVSEIDQNVPANSGTNGKIAVNAQGPNLYILESSYADGTSGFAPFFITPDNGERIRVDRANVNLRLGSFKRLTLENPNANAGGINVVLYSGLGDYRQDIANSPQVQVSPRGCARAVGAKVYAAGQAIVFNGSIDHVVFDQLARTDGGNGNLTKFRITKNNSSDGSFRLYLFSETPSLVAGMALADGDALALQSDSAGPGSVPYFVGIVDFPSFIVESAGAWAYCEVVARMPFVCQQGSRALWGILVAEAAYNATDSEAFGITLWAERS
jgi:hypothetical protein